jgi:hypothetical protein
MNVRPRGTVPPGHESPVATANLAGTPPLQV